MPEALRNIGELFMAGYAGIDPAEAEDLICRHRVGGIILFTRNVKDADHTASVCAKLQEMRRRVSDTPLFIAIDQEGGCVARITEGVTVFPGSMALGAAGSDDLARRAAETTGAELATLGINVNFAPVLDLGSNSRNPGVGARSFGSNPASAARLGAIMIEGMQKMGVLATAKHFPGLGEARVDSHDELPIVRAGADTLENRELEPFRAAIDVGVSFAMTAHCAFPALDETMTPATLSRPMLTGILRERLGFGGVIITDCLEMLSIEKDFPAPEASLAAIKAGATMALICHTREKQTAAIAAMEQALDNGDISAETIDSALAIIASVKEKLTSGDIPARIAEPQTALSERIAVEAVTIVRNAGGLIPLRLDDSESLAVIAPAFDALTKVEEAAEPHEALRSELKLRHPRIHYEKVPVQPSAEQAELCLGSLKDADKLLILTYNMHMYPEQLEMVLTLLSLGKPAVVAAVRDPVDLALIEESCASTAPVSLIATYGFRECSLKALVGALFGEFEAKGNMPVDLKGIE
jgi:beta-N-acetylhexosaminidase